MRKQTMGAEDPGSWGGEEAGDTWMSNYLHPLTIPWTVGNPVLVKEGAHPFADRAFAFRLDHAYLHQTHLLLCFRIVSKFNHLFLKYTTTRISVRYVAQFR